VLNAIKTHF
jgi:hypothetical protein